MSKHCDETPNDEVVLSNEVTAAGDTAVDSAGEDTDAGRAFWTRQEHRETDPGLEAAAAYSGPVSDPAQSSWSEVGLPQLDGRDPGEDERPTVEYGGPGNGAEAEFDGSGAEVADTDAEVPAPAPRFQPIAKMVLTPDEENQLIIERIKEIEIGMFKDELIAYELSETGQDNGLIFGRITTALKSLDALAKLYNSRTGG